MTAPLNLWLWIVLIAMIVTFLSATIFTKKRVLIFLTTSILLITIGYILGTYSTDKVWTSLSDGLPIFAIIIALEIFSIAIIDEEIPEWAMTRILTKSLSPLHLHILFIFIAYFLSLWINNLAAILVLIPFVLKAGQALKFRLEPLLVAMVIASNLGGASMMIGDFPNIVISRYADANFIDFFVNLGLPIIFLIIIFYGIYYYPYLADVKKSQNDPINISHVEKAKKYYLWLDIKLTTRARIIIALFVVMGIVFALWQDFDPAFIAILFAMILLLIIKSTDEIFKKINIDILILFATLFIISGALQSTGILQNLGNNLLENYPTNPLILALFLLIISAFFTAFLSAGPSTMMLIPLAQLFNDAIPNNMAWWALSLGVLAGSSATPIGATAGPVTISVYERRTGKKFSYRAFLKIGIPSALAFIFISFMYLIFRLS